MVVTVHLSWSSMARWLRRPRRACLVTVYPRRSARQVRRDALVAGLACAPWVLLAVTAHLAGPHLRPVPSLVLLAAGVWQAGPRLCLGRGETLDLSVDPEQAFRLLDPVTTDSPLD
jgi:hypothetical protein